MFAAVAITAVCDSAGALLAGGDVIKTVARGIIAPGAGITAENFRYLTPAAVLAPTR